MDALTLFAQQEVDRERYEDERLSLMNDPGWRKVIEACEARNRQARLNQFIQFSQAPRPL